MHKKWGGIQQKRHRRFHKTHRIHSQEDEKECRIKKEHSKWITHAFEKLESRVKSLERDKEFATRKENHE